MSDERFDMLSQNYEAEQKQMEAEVITLRQEIETQEQQNENVEKFIQKAHKYAGIKTLNPYALQELVQAIYVGLRISPAVSAARVSTSSTMVWASSQ